MLGPIIAAAGIGAYTAIKSKQEEKRIQLTENKTQTPMKLEEMRDILSLKLTDMQTMETQTLHDVIAERDELRKEKAALDAENLRLTNRLKDIEALSDKWLLDWSYIRNRSSYFHEEEQLKICAEQLKRALTDGQKGAEG